MAEVKKTKEKAKVNEDKLKALQLTMDKMDKTYGKRFSNETWRWSS